MNRAALIAVLGSDRWFNGLSADLAEAILDGGRLRKLADARIYSATDRGDGIVALLSGQFRISRVDATGRPSLLLIGSPGSWIGISSALDGRPHGYDLMAVGETAFFHLSQEKMEAVIGDRVERHAAFTRLLCDRYRSTMDQVAARRSQRPLQILAYELIRLTERHGRQTGEGIVLEMKLSQEDLAVMIGVGRQTVNRLLKGLEQQGIASVNYASMTIHDVPALRRLKFAHAENI
ncbi:MAG: Crp/Fnr family transcriptional regulator [Rhizobiaceae bacterium]